jgi:PEP-CTERM motif
MKITFRSVALLFVAAFVSASVVAKPPPPAPPPACGASDVSGVTFLSCSGYFEGNYISGNAGDKTFADTQLSSLGLTGTGGTWLEKIDGLGGSHTINFDAALSGIVYFGIHKGGAGEGAQSTAWYKIDVGNTPLDSFTYNLQGSSNAALYGFTAPVPEPGTYSLMLAGLAIVAFMARRSARQ